MADETFALQVAEVLAKPYLPFSPLTGDEVARAVAAIRREIGEWGSDRLHAHWARILAKEVWGPDVAAAIRAAHGSQGWKAAELLDEAALTALRGSDV